MVSSNIYIMYRETVRSVAVLLGAHDLSSSTETNLQGYYASDVYINSLFDYYFLRNDIALLQLTSAVTITGVFFLILSILFHRSEENGNYKITYNEFCSSTNAEYVRPIYLAGSFEPNHAKDIVTVAGWGLTSDGTDYNTSMIAMTIASGIKQFHTRIQCTLNR